MLPYLTFPPQREQRHRLTAPKQCAASSPSCTCTFCTVNYHCPACARKPNVQAKCRLDAELRAKKEAELRALAKLEKDREERGHADELAGALNEFFAALYTGGPDNALSAAAGAGAGSVSPNLEFPLSSPDSITVTTEFGVLQETGNLTVITAGGAYLQDYVDVNDADDADEDDGVEMTEHLHEEQHDSSSSSIMTTTTQQHPSSNDMGDEAEVDTDDASMAVGGGVSTQTAPAAAGQEA